MLIHPQNDSSMKQRLVFSLFILITVLMTSSRTGVGDTSNAEESRRKWKTFGQREWVSGVYFLHFY